MAALEAIVKAKTGITQEEWQEFVKQAEHQIEPVHQLAADKGGFDAVIQFLERAIKRQ